MTLRAIGFDIDIQAQEAARKNDVRLERPPALNTDPVFMKQLADLIEDKAAEEGWVNGS